MPQFIRPTVDRVKVTSDSKPYRNNAIINLDHVHYFQPGLFTAGSGYFPAIQFSMPEHDNFVVWVFNNEQEQQESLYRLQQATGVAE